MSVTLFWRWAVGLAVLLTGCASLPPMPARQNSHALADGSTTRWGQRVAAERGATAPGLSGFKFLAGGEEALGTLLALADGAERTLDLQYYAVLNEASSRVLLQRVHAAAERGVRVRLLVDDFNTAGTDDALLRLTRHPRIEVRLYNPLPAGRFSVFTKVMASLNDVPRINNRMHNKQFVADNALAVTGGRNLGDAYFLQSPDANFVDLDFLVAGPVVRQLSATFDRYWNSELAYPVAVLNPAAASASAPPGPPPQAPRDAPPAQADPASGPAPAAPKPLDAPDTLPAERRGGVEAHARALAEKPLGLQWSPARLMSDAPSKTLAEGAPSNGEIMFDDFTALLRSARTQVLLVTPYFVPGEAGMALIGELRARGVRVRILTASFAGTDAPAVYLGYSKYREPLIDLGVELYELRAVPGGPQPRRLGGVHSRTNLHAKAALVDAGTVLVGSMNFDPRSEKLNTEMALLARSAALGRQLEALFDEILRDGAFRLEKAPGGGLRWRSLDASGQPVVFDREPDVSLLKWLGWKLLSPLAPEQML